MYFTDVLIIGAGPFGLAVAAHAQDLGMDCMVVGKTMEFWKENMPEGMLLRSPSTWHLDVKGEATIERFEALDDPNTNPAKPLTLAFYIRYAKWFETQKKLRVLQTYVQQLDRNPDAHFEALTESGQRIRAKYVVLALGFKYFVNIPADLSAVLPSGSYEHTCTCVALKAHAKQRCLILGGRQSAFEWAALLHEAGAASVHVAYRHATPDFVEADWSWVERIIEQIPSRPDWYRTLSESQQNQVVYELWAEGRLKLEPWLKRRLQTPTVHLLPHTNVLSCQTLPEGMYRVQFDNAPPLEVDKIILATGYKSAFENIPFLQKGNLLSQIEIREGFPYLDSGFQSSVPGLYVTSLPAGKDFGPFFGFTVAARASAQVIVRHLAAAAVSH